MAFVLSIKLCLSEHTHFLSFTLLILSHMLRVLKKWLCGAQLRSGIKPWQSSLASPVGLEGLKIKASFIGMGLAAAV